MCLDHLRKKHNRRETSAADVKAGGEEHDLLDQLADDGTLGNPEREVFRREIGQHISLALTRLTPREPIIFEMKHYQGLTRRNVSEILNCSEASIKTSLFRGMQTLRLHLARFYLRKNSSTRHPVMSAG